MSEIAYITRLGGSPLSYDSSINNIGKGGGAAYSLRRADGTKCGTYQTVGEAQRAFRTLVGDTLVKWYRRDLSGQIESYYATD